MGFQVTLAPTSSHQPTQGWFCCSGGCDSWEHRGKYPLRQEGHLQLPPQGPGSCLASLLSHSPQGSNSSHEFCKSPDPQTQHWLPYSVKDQSVPRPVFPNKPAIPHCSSLLAPISHSEFTPLKPRTLPSGPFLLPAWNPIHLGCHW